MSTRTAVIASKVGLHARPAKLFIQKVNEAGIPVTIAKAGGKAVNASSMLGVMALGARCGDEVELNADGPDADKVLDELVELLETDLDA